MGQEHDATVKLADAFTTSAAVMTETSERTVRREVRRGEVLGDEVLSKVAGTSLDKGEELDTLTKLSPKKRNELIKRAAGETVSARVQAKQEHRKQREAKLGEKIAAGNLAQPAKRYGIILADWPRGPWAIPTKPAPIALRRTITQFRTSAVRPIHLQAQAATNAGLLRRQKNPPPGHAVIEQSLIISFR
jgi:hypothetical protein